MAKRKGKEAVLQQRNWEEFLMLSRTSAALRAAADANFSGPVFDNLVEEASQILGWKVEMPELLNAIRNTKVYRESSSTSHDESLAAIFYLECCWKDFMSRHKANHWTKCLHVHELGLSLPCYSALAMITSKTPRNQRPFHLKFVERRRQDGIKRYHDLYDANAATAKSYTVDELNGFYTVPQDESTIFYSYDETGEMRLELAVIRDVVKSTPFSDSLYGWLEDVVHAACSERRNVQPTHPGCMTQIGLNLGPRHARVLGWAKSFVRDLDSVTRIDRDTDAVGAVSITWSIIQSVMPQEILNEVYAALEAEGLPPLATRDVDVGNGHGFHIRANGTAYHFPTAERAPPEAYFAVGYQAWTHTDPTYCGWAFASCIARRDIRRKKKQRGTGQKAGGTMPTLGENFVDVSLRVVVQQATHTILAFRPDHLHGTTRSVGAENAMISISFSQRLATAWAEADALTKAAVISGTGAGVTSDSESRG